MFQAELQSATLRHRKPNSPSRTPATLTKAQVCVMPDCDYMNTAQLAFFTALLTGTEVDLVNKVRRADIKIAAGATGADPVDRASEEEEHRMALSTRARDACQLLDGIERLMIRPTAILTTEAQRRQENRTRRFRA